MNKAEETTTTLIVIDGKEFVEKTKKEELKKAAGITAYTTKFRENFENALVTAWLEHTRKGDKGFFIKIKIDNSAEQNFYINSDELCKLIEKRLEFENVGKAVSYIFERKSAEILEYCKEMTVSY